MCLWSKDRIHYPTIMTKLSLFFFQLISSVSTGVQSNKITTLFDFQCCHNMYLNFFTIHEVGKLWTGLVLHHIRYSKVSDFNYMYKEQYK